jgi:hypothetical protein
MPERTPNAYTQEELQNCKGICSDYIGWYKQRAEAATRIGMIIGGRLTCHQDHLLPQVRTYLSTHPDHWIDIHFSINDYPEAKDSKYLKEAWLDAPFVATFTCQTYTVPSHYIHHPRKRPETVAQNTMSMFYNNMLAYQQLKTHGTYDIVIKYRPDIVAKNLPEVSHMIDPAKKETKLYMPDCHVFEGANDQIGIGSMQTMEIYCDVYTDADHYLSTDQRYALHPESMLKYQLDKHHVVIERFTYPYHLDGSRKSL